MQCLNLNTMNEINLYLGKLVTLTNFDWKFLSLKPIRFEFPKKTIVLDIEKNENYMSLIKNGILRKYFPNENDDKTFELVFAGNFASAYDFYLTRQQSTYIIETISPSILLCISYSDLQSYYNLTPFGKTIDRSVSEEHFLKKSKLEIALISLLP